jgi:ArsR family transcriptional regulator, arsenate/arsenite/antimonite-responsive transcriptional repressor
MPRSNGQPVAFTRGKAEQLALSQREVLAVSRALSDPRRFQILQHIAAKSCTACSDLRGAFPITPATLSHHLKELESCGLIETARRGKFVDVTFCRPAWEAYLTELKRV